MKYGLPYKGSKNKLAKRIVRLLRPILRSDAVTTNLGELTN